MLATYLRKLSGDVNPGTECGPTNPPSEKAPGVKLTTNAGIEKLREDAEVAMRSGKMNTAIKLINQRFELEHGIKPTQNRGG